MTMTKSIEITVPDIGDFDAVEVIEVLVSEGDAVAVETPLITLESDKATMEIPVPSAGSIAKLLVKVGDKVSQGTAIATLQPSDAAASSDPTEAESKPESQPETQTETETDATPEPKPAPTPSPPPPAAQPAPTPAATTPGKIPHASPAVRRFARELGATLEKIVGSGPKGRILRDDVANWVKAQLSQSSGGGIPPIPTIDFSKFGEIETVPLSRIQKLSGPHLQRAWLNVPHVTHHDLADITELEEFRQSLKPEAEKAGVRITLLGFVIKILASALKKFPSFNASLHPDGENLVRKKYVHIGIAVDTPNGLVVPVIRDASAKTIMELAQEMGDLSARAREGKLKPQELQGGCMSISSLGGIGGSAFTPIVNAPEVAILGLTRAKWMPHWDGKKFIPRLMLPLDLSYDHRVIDGAEAARFVAFLVEALADARRISL